LNVQEDVIRDIAILKTETLEDLHKVLINVFGFEGNEMAAFYESDDDWTQGEEYPLFDMGDNLDPKIQMKEILLENVLAVKTAKLIYVYDFFNMWTFYIELIETDLNYIEPKLPGLLFSLGALPKNAPDLAFESENPGEFEDDDEEDEFGFDGYME
ncbi:MAG: hypothetical protein DRQ89_14885, partial [Epsilonproteobacteria bacterium]